MQLPTWFPANPSTMKAQNPPINTAGRYCHARSLTFLDALIGILHNSRDHVRPTSGSLLSLAAVRRSSRRPSQFSSLSRCGPKTAESVLVSLSLRSEEVLDGRVSYRVSLAAASLHRPSRDCLVSLSTLYGAGKVFFSRVTCLTELELQPPIRRFIFRTRQETSTWRDMITPSRGFLDAVFSDTTEEGRHLLTRHTQTFTSNSAPMRT